MRDPPANAQCHCCIVRRVCHPHRQRARWPGLPRHPAPRASIEEQGGICGIRCEGTPMKSDLAPVVREQSRKEFVYPKWTGIRCAVLGGVWVPPTDRFGNASSCPSHFPPLVRRSLFSSSVSHNGRFRPPYQLSPLTVGGREGPEARTAQNRRARRGGRGRTAPGAGATGERGRGARGGERLVAAQIHSWSESPNRP